MSSQKKVKEVIEKWQINIDLEPLQLKGQIIDAGDVLLGKKK